jgi:hypothetical protein
MVINSQFFAHLEQFEARPYAGRHMSGKYSLGVVGLDNLTTMLRAHQSLPVTGWLQDMYGLRVIYYNMNVLVSREVVDNYYDG